MTAVRNVEPVQRICAVIAGQDDHLQRAIDYLIDRWGSVSVRSQCIPFHAGGFYDQSMGANLHKVLIGFTAFEDPSDLAEWKVCTNVWEAELADGIDAAVERPVNLDPGYITQSKLVLATIKDRDHRMYLREGIFAEVTLNYVGSRWVHHRWTYPSYRTEAVAKFASDCRERLRQYILANGLTRHA